MVGAVSEADALLVARSVARSNLFKCAVFGEDPNWGRVLASLGTTGPTSTSTPSTCASTASRCARPAGARGPGAGAVRRSAVTVLIDLHAGDAAATVRTNDLTTDYVHENSAYST